MKNPLLLPRQGVKEGDHRRAICVLEHQASLNLADTTRTVGAGDAPEGGRAASHTRYGEVGLVQHVVKLPAELETQSLPGQVEGLVHTGVEL